MVLLIIGGSGSGKSEYAEQRAVELNQHIRGKLFYIATMEPFDEESRRRIRRHREMRKEKHFTTIECSTRLERVKLPQNSTVLLECISNLTANEMYGKDGRGEGAAEKIAEGICHLNRQAANLVLVGNNVFEDGITYDASTMEYIKNMAWIQNQTAVISDEVIEVVHGIPVTVSGKGKQE